MRLLIAEDEVDLAEALAVFFEKNHFSVDAVHNGFDAYEYASSGAYDAVILDVMMPKMMGFDVCRALREEGDNVPVIILTAREEEEDKILGLEIGADDYITKPFGIMELLSRVKAVLRRSGGKTAQKQGQLSCQGLLLDLDRRTASYESTEIVLTYKEFELLAYLMRNRGTAVSRDRLLEEVWGFQYEGETRTVDAHIKTLRQKLEAAECRNLIGTVRGYGYKIGG